MGSSVPGWAGGRLAETRAAICCAASGEGRMSGGATGVRGAGTPSTPLLLAASQSSSLNW
eukprot:9387504-Alexandrium_andersonii.AAC.1